MCASKEMPKYKCHKEVWALKIVEITHYMDGSACLYPENTDYDSIRVDNSFMEKHRPKSGGYYVVYEGGYQSYSPAEVFEKGYTLIQ